MRPDGLRTFSLSVVEATPKTRWTFLEVETDDGWCGVGEATLSGREDEVVEAVATFVAKLLAEAELPCCGTGGLPAAAARSSLDQALRDIEAQRRGERLADMLGGVRRDRVPVYANINRRVGDRSPAAFADSARTAVATGHRAIKLAPFDEASVSDAPDAALRNLEPGLARIAAVRAALGDDAQIMVDCHWRFTAGTAERVIDAAAELGVVWLECPLLETPDRIADIAGLRLRANRRGMLLAGLETAVGLEAFRPFIRAGAYDVMMPDVKYVGSLAEMLRLAEELRAAGIGFSPHNPSGPVCHAVSLQVCAAVEALHSLEIQFDETPVFAALIDRDLQATEAGMIAVPTGPGIDAALRREPLERHRVRHWTMAAQEA